MALLTAEQVADGLPPRWEGGTDGLRRVLRYRDFAEALAVRDRVNAALAQIPEQFREALVLREFGDLTYESIAAHQGVGVQTVKSRLNRARAALAAELARQDEADRG